MTQLSLIWSRRAAFLGILKERRREERREERRKKRGEKRERRKREVNLINPQFIR